jgi:hypothetical protein
MNWWQLLGAKAKVGLENPVNNDVTSCSTLSENFESVHRLPPPYADSWTGAKCIHDMKDTNEARVGSFPSNAQLHNVKEYLHAETQTTEQYPDSMATPLTSATLPSVVSTPCSVRSRTVSSGLCSIFKKKKALSDGKSNKEETEILTLRQENDKLKKHLTDLEYLCAQMVIPSL